MPARDLRQRFEELAVVADIASAMLSPLELSQVLHVALEKTSRAMRAPFGSITLLSADKTRLEFAAVYGLSADYGERFREIWGCCPPTNRRLPAVRSPPASPIGCGISRAIRSAQSWKHISLGEGVRALICVPLFLAGEPAGSLNQYMAEPHKFSGA